MSQIKAYVALVMLLAAAGCASGPEVADEALAATTAATAVAATEEPGTVVPVTVLDVNQLVASQAPPVICREILRRGSNVHVSLCGTAEQWKRYAHREAEDAAALTRMMQGGRYR